VAAQRVHGPVHCTREQRDLPLAHGRAALLIVGHIGSARVGL
jgi:hypothetical protein